MPGQTVLILSTEPIIGALLGIYAELYMYRPVFADAWQTSDQAVAQADPAIIIVDLEHPDGASAPFVARQRAAGRAVIAFGAHMDPSRVTTSAGRLGIPSFLVPIDAPGFRVVLDDAAREAARKRERLR